SDALFPPSTREKKATACCLRKHRKNRTDFKDMKKMRETCKKDRARIRRNVSVNSSKCSKPSFEDQNKFSTTPERLSKPQQVTSDLRLDVGVSRLCLHKLEVDFPSTFESHSMISDSLGPKFNSEFAYIYAESIKGCDSTCCTCPGDCNTHNPLVRSTESVFDGESESSEDSHWDLYMSACSMAAMAGSRLSADRFGSLLDDFDSSCIYTEWERRAGSTETEQGYSPAEAEWGSAASSGSESSCYTADRDSYCTTDRQTSSSESDRCRSEALSDIKCPEVFLPGCFESCDAVKDVCRDAESRSECFCSRRETGELWGVVTQMNRRHFSECFCEMIKEVTQEREVEKMNVNEGFLFHPKQ
ncbi:hypothetical protein M9458_047544, partial [Cirrhinus mrigala]